MIMQVRQRQATKPADREMNRRHIVVSTDDAPVHRRAKGLQMAPTGITPGMATDHHLWVAMTCHHRRREDNPGM